MDINADSRGFYGALPHILYPETYIQVTAIRFVLAHSVVTTAIVGTQNPDHMRGNIEEISNDSPLSQAVVKELHRRFDELDDNWYQLT